MSDDNNNKLSRKSKQYDDPRVVTDKEKVNYTPETNDPSTFKYYPDDPESTMARYKFQTKGISQYYDPCEQSAKMSMRCLEQNDYDRSQCKEYFDAYRECKKQWLEARRNNRSNWE